VAQDYAAALNWYRKAAKQGDARAKFNLGLMYAIRFRQIRRLPKFVRRMESNAQCRGTNDCRKPGCNRRSGAGDGGMMPA